MNTANHIIRRAKRTALVEELTTIKVEVATRALRSLSGGTTPPAEARVIADRYCKVMDLEPASEAALDYQMSVGLYHYSEEYIGRGQRATVNGRTVDGPVNVLRGGRVRECSIVTLGADVGAKVQMFGHSRRDKMPDVCDVYRRHNSEHKFD